MNTKPDRSFLSRPVVRARVLVAVTAVTALVGVIVVAPAAFAAAPGAPAQPVATAADGQISVAFTAPVGATGFAASCPSSDGGTAGSVTGAASPLVVTSVTNGKTYTCTVTASNTTDGSGPPSPASNAVIPSGLPGTPDPPTATAGDGRIVVAFTPPPDNGRPISKVLATCTSQADGSLTSNPGTASPITVVPLTNGVTYACTVTATNANGDGPTSGASNAVTPVAATSVPTAPRNVSVNASDSQILVSFAAPLSDGGSAINGYTAGCTSSNGGSQGLGSGGGSPITVGGLDDGKSYTCTVVATNGVGNGATSTPSASVIPKGVPAAPAKPTVVGSDSSISVTFVAPFNGGTPITSYTATCTSFDSGVSTSRSAATVTPIVIPGLNNGVTYGCSVTARNAVGASDSSPSSDSVVPDRGPDSPATPAVSAANAQIRVGFTAPSNGGSPITGYTARCAPANGGAINTASAGGSAASIVVTHLSNGRTYRCTVLATNVKGSSLPSPASAPVVPSTVPGIPAAPGVTADNASVNVSFRAPANGGSAITSYVAGCSSSNGGRSGSRAGTTSPLNVAGLTNAKSYRCFVTARNVRGSGARSALSAAVSPSDLITIQSTQRGFRLFGGDGGVFTFGVDRSFGSASGVATHEVVGMASTPDTKGYWLVATDGGIFSFGNAHFWGSTGAIRLNQPIVGMTPTPTGHGYWLVASDGGIFAYGDAHFWGSTGAIRLNQPIVGMASTPTGHGYWLVASDGGIFAFGDARFHGAPTGSTHSAVVGMATTSRGGGYWIAAADGSVYNFGDAPALGGVTIRATRLPLRGIASTPSGHGYWLAAGDGGVFTFGDAPFIGWPGPLVLRAQIQGVSR